MKCLTISFLEEYLNELNEINQIEKSIASENKKRRELLGKAVTSDTVTGSSVDFPYVKQTYTVTGIEEKVLEQEYKRSLEAAVLLEKRKEKLHKNKIEVYKSLIKIDDSLVRQIVDLRYLQGKEWKEISLAVCRSTNETTPYMIIKRYFNEKSI